MTQENRWNLLKDWLLRDWWSPIEACHIFALLVRTEKDGFYGSRAILSEHRQRRDLEEKLKDRAKDYLKIWQAAKHEPDEDEYYRSSISNEFYTKEYCVKWAQKKSIKIPWLDWAIEEKLIIFKDKQLKDLQDLEAAISDKQMGKKKEENLLRLIGRLISIVKDKTGQSQKELIAYLHTEEIDIEKDGLQNKGLSERSLKEVFAKANAILKSEDA
ncbi:hypothetical protein N9C14_03500 [Gammaproteobacteria bacterium]|nr:hypothetical protein [Gammaproteobacteria bacterium]MDA9783899.1 hypothetical protein [Gammaproteobacteria bacterium]MDB4155674.1 hypothetical protein [Gammaproteobacteria bacterium]